MRVFVFIAFVCGLLTSAEPVLSQQVGDVHKNPDSLLSWWERVSNQYSWLRQQLGTRYTFERSIGVIIAIDDYSGEFDDLASPVRDSVRMKDFLLDEAGFDEVYVLTNAAANSANIRALMENAIPTRVGPNDRLLVYWSGHGGSARDSRDRPFGFLALQNATKDGRIDSIHMDEAKSWLRRTQARQVLFVIDACYSGLSLQMSNDPSDPTWEQMAGPGDHMLTSSSDTQVSYGHSDGSGGLFTKAFLEGARGAADSNRDGLATITEIAAYLESELSETAGLGFVQTPQFGTVGRQEGRFFFLSGHTPTPLPSRKLSPAQPLGNACSAANNDYALFVRNAQNCWEVEAFLGNHRDARSCTALLAAESRRDELCSNQTSDRCDSVISPDGMKCIVDANGMVAFVVIEKTELSPGAPDPVLLRIQTHFSAEKQSGQAVAQFVKDVETATGGEVTIEMFYASAVVKSVETFDAAATGILDCDMTGAAYQTRKDIAFQFIGDLFGGYETPNQQLSWLNFEDAEELVQDLYAEYGMHFVGWWIPGQDSLASSSPLRGLDDARDWKFRSPPGVAAAIWEEIGASPIVMDFNEIFTALETGIIDGADATNLVNNTGLGLYDIANHTTYPGFHSMPADHLACRKDKWETLSARSKNAISIALNKMAFELAADVARRSQETARELRSKGVELYDWSQSDRSKFREATLRVMERFAESSDHAKKILDSHRRYMKTIGLLS